MRTKYGRHYTAERYLSRARTFAKNPKTLDIAWGYLRLARAAVDRMPEPA